ncbi:fimbrial protein [Escherichia coli]
MGEWYTFVYVNLDPVIQPGQNLVVLVSIVAGVMAAGTTII